MPPSHTQELIRAWNNTAAAYPRDAIIPDLFQQQALRSPDASAVAWDGGAWNYRELHARVRRAASQLRRRGVHDGDLVGVLLERSPQAVVAIMAILEAGGVFVPLDPESPATRLESICGSAPVSHVIAPPGGLPDSIRQQCQEVTTSELADAVNSTANQFRAANRSATDPAYVMYTSGSTGSPKGVVCPHRGPIRLVSSGGYLQFQPRDRLLATTNLVFDISCLEIFGCLLNGACLIVPRIETPLSTNALMKMMRDQRASVMWLSSGLFDQHVQQFPDMFASLRCLIVGGDVVSPSSARAVLTHGCPSLFLNGYGPTENSVLCTAHHIDQVPAGTSSIPIGRPLPNCTAYVVREDGELAAPEEIGELWLGGDGVALEYLNSPEKTSLAFVPDRFGLDPDGRLYRSGDLACWHPDGVLEYHGRRDRQVKIRGYRIELGEVESVLTTHPDVLEAAVGTLGSGSDEHLASVVVPTTDANRSDLVKRLRDYVRQQLPPYMTPARFAVVREIPLTTSGKVNRKALIDLMTQQGQEAASRRGNLPQGTVEKRIAQVWSELLENNDINRDDQFYSLGGTSLRAAQVATAACQRLGLPPRANGPLIRSLASNPTLCSFAETAKDAYSMADSRIMEPTIDFAAEAELDARLRFDLPPAGLANFPRTVFLTGGTGFLGVHLIDCLISSGVDVVFCLVRDSDTATATDRINARMRRYGLDPARCENSIIAIPGNLAEPRFGLDSETWGRLSRDTELILHNGAQVNFIYPYEALRPTNVIGTRTVLDLAVDLSVKPVHYVSTIDVIPAIGPPDGCIAHENDELSHPENLLMGYAQSKWVAERLVMQASERGLPTAIYRPYEVTGSRERGIWNTNTLTCILFKTIAEIDTAPGIPWPLDFVPVDYIAESITHIVRSEQPNGQVYHLSNPSGARLPLLVDRLRAAGYHVEYEPYQAWTRHISELTASEPGHPMAPYLPLFTSPVGPGGLSIQEMRCPGRFPEFGRSNTERALQNSEITCPPVDAHLIDKYLGFLRDSDFLPPPKGPAGGWGAG